MINVFACIFLYLKRCTLCRINDWTILNLININTIWGKKKKIAVYAIFFSKTIRFQKCLFKISLKYHQVIALATGYGRCGKYMRWDVEVMEKISKLVFLCINTSAKPFSALICAKILHRIENLWKQFMPSGDRPLNIRLVSIAYLKWALKFTFSIIF